MFVRVWFARRITGRMLMLMVLIVDMLVRMFHALMYVQMLVIFCQMQPDPNGHQ